MSTNFNQQEIPVKATLDVQTVETALNELWRGKAGTKNRAGEDEDNAVMRARVLNLMVYVTGAEAATEVNEILAEITKNHPCRALVILAEAQAEDRDIEIFISTYCPESSDAGGRRVCCEQVTLRARGRFTVELPSMATPLLVSDLPVFLYWQDTLRPDDEVFQNLSHAADRVVIDSAEFLDPLTDLPALVKLLSRKRSFEIALSDLNWTRLTSWRALLAGFYDVQEYRPALAALSHVTIEYVAPQRAPDEIAPQALMFAGWLASRLGWQLAADKLVQGEHEDSRVALWEKGGGRLQIEFRRVSRPEMKQGRLARVELKAKAGLAASFVVSRSEDGLYLETQATMGEEVRAARVLKVRNRSAAVLLGRELEIVHHDEVYEEALKSAADIARLS